MAAAQNNGGATSGMNNLTTLIKRLEAATSRLEDIALSAATFDQQQQPQPNGSSSASGAAVASGIPMGSKGGSREASTSTVKEILPPAIEDMDTLIREQVKTFVDSSSGLDPLLDQQASSVAKAFADQRRFLVVTTKAKKPDPTSKTFMELLVDLQQDIGSIGDLRDSNRGSSVKEQLSMVGEGITALTWLVMDGKPADYVGEIIGGAQMYGNRVLKQYKESDQSQVKYVQAYYALLKALQTYIKKHYPSGVTWNNNGSDDPVAAYTNAASGVSANDTQPRSTGGAPPPPPPPPPLPSFDNAPPPPPPPPGAAPANKANGGDMGAVFDQLNRGESVTSGLKKVDKSQMTHKNPSLRAGSTVPDKDVASADISRSRSPGPEIKPKPQSMRQNSTTSTRGGKPAVEPKKELDGNKWLVENFDSPGAPVELDVSLTQSILVSRCKNTTLILRGKANAVSIDNCARTQILVDTLVSSVDVIKCPGFAIQVTGSLPTILLDQVDGASVYLGKESLNTEIFTSKCSSVNIVLPPDSDADDSTEHPLPEQIRTVVKGGKLVSEIVEHAG